MQESGYDSSLSCDIHTRDKDTLLYRRDRQMNDMQRIMSAPQLVGGVFLQLAPSIDHYVHCRITKTHRFSIKFTDFQMHNTSGVYDLY